MQTEFRTILWRRGLSMMLFVLFSVTVAMAQVLVRGTVVDQTGKRYWCQYPSERDYSGNYY